MSDTIRDMRARAIKMHQEGRLSEAAALYARYLAQVPTDAGTKARGCAGAR